MPLPFSDDDLHGLVSNGDVHVASYGRRIVALDDATGAMLWSVDEPSSQRMWGLTMRANDVCATLVSDTISKVRCYSLASGQAVLTIDVPKAFRLAGNGPLYVGDSAGAVHAYTNTGVHQWTWRPSEAAVGVYALSATSDRVEAAILHDGPTGIGSGDDYVVTLDLAGKETRRTATIAGGQHRAPYSLLAQGATTWVGLDGGWLMRIGTAGTAVHEVGHGAAIVALALDSQLLAGSLRGALSLHNADTLADAWPTYRTTDAGHVRGLHLGADILSAHRGGWILESPRAAAAHVLIRSPVAGDRIGTSEAEVVVSRQGPAATSELELRWITPTGGTLPAAKVLLEAQTLPVRHRIPLMASNVPDGSGYRLEAVLHDPLGDAAARSTGKFVVDTTPPAVLTLDPPRGAVLAAVPKVLVATWLDPVAGIDPERTTLLMDGVVAPGRVAAAGQSRAEPTSMADGPHTLTAIGYDRSGNRAEVTWNFRLDAQPPLIEGLERVTAGPNYVQVKWSTNEAAACAAGTSPPTPKVPAAGQGLQQHQAIITGLSPGSQVRVHVSCIDAAGHKAAPAYLDVTTAAASGPPPTLTVTAPGPDGSGGWYRTTPSIDATVSSGALHVAIDGGAYEATPSPFTPPEGDHRIELVALGAGGASTPWVERIRVDTAAPSVPIVTAPRTVQSTMTLLWEGGLDDGDPVPAVEVERLDGDWLLHQRVTGAVGGAVVAAEPGNHTYRVVAVDRAGHRTPSAHFDVASTGTPIARMKVELEGDAVLDPGVPLRVRVLVPDGHRPFLRVLGGGEELLRDASPTGFNLDGKTWWTFTTPTATLRPGAYQVQVSAPDQAPISMAIEVRGIQGPDGGAVEVRQRESPAPVWLVLAALLLARRS